MIGSRPCSRLVISSPYTIIYIDNYSHCSMSAVICWQTPLRHRNSRVRADINSGQSARLWAWLRLRRLHVKFVLFFLISLFKHNLFLIHSYICIHCCELIQASYLIF